MFKIFDFNSTNERYLIRAIDIIIFVKRFQNSTAARLIVKYNTILKTLLHSVCFFCVLVRFRPSVKMAFSETCDCDISWFFLFFCDL